MRLSSTFLKPYYAQGDCFPNLLARSVYRSKYQRPEDSCWTDTVKRVVEGNCALDPKVHKREAEQLFHSIWTMKMLPPGRGLWTGGTPIPAAASFNCLSGDTKIFANGELKTLRELENKKVGVICDDGVERTAVVHSFGTQTTYEYTFKHRSDSKYAIKVRATADHRWFTKRGEVTDLQVGDQVLVTPREVDDNVTFNEGYAHGFVFGDGSEKKSGGFQLRLCGKKADNLTVLGHYASSWSFPPSFKGDPVLQFNDVEGWKEVPQSYHSWDYQAGFLAGLLDADGFVVKSKDGRGLDLSDNETIQWIVDRAPLLGYCVTGDYKINQMVTNYGPRKEQPRRIALTKKPIWYKVVSVDSPMEEKVFCAVQPETQSFTLASGLVTGNCYACVLRDPSDWCWLADQSMLGGGVGVSLLEIEKLPVVSLRTVPFKVGCRVDHPNSDEVQADWPFDTHFYAINDSREGWVEALEIVLTGAFNGTSVYLDVSDIRPRGAPIKGFGGIACGPGPLVRMLRNVWNVIREAAGRKLTSVECLDITTHIADCIRSGNVRRSAIIILGRPEDEGFMSAKKGNWFETHPHRSNSNNSIMFETDPSGYDWEGFFKDMTPGSELPGIANLWLARHTDRNVVSLNPCAEQFLEHRESCNLVEVFPARGAAHKDFELATRYAMRQRLQDHHDPVSDEVGKRNRRIGVAVGGVCDIKSEYLEDELKEYAEVVRGEANMYAKELGILPPITVTTVKPSGTISLLNDSSPGMHAPYAPYYLRRIRIAKNEPMAEALIEAGVPHETCVYDKTGHTWVFEIPMSKEATAYVTTESARDQFERQALLQEAYADNAVSATITYTEEEWSELPALFAEYVPRLKSTSVLAKAHGFAQPPYQELTEFEYRLRYQGIDHSHPLTNGEYHLDECAGGVCPIK